MDSMFYVKTKISDECEINTSISCDNVYTRCKKCGGENLMLIWPNGLTLSRRTELTVLVVIYTARNAVRNEEK